MMLTITPEDGIHVIDPKLGKRRLYPGEIIDTGDGNEIQINAEGYTAGVLHGIGYTLVVVFVVLGVCGMVGVGS